MRRGSITARLGALLALASSAFAATAQPIPPLNRFLNERIVPVETAPGMVLETTLFKPDGDGPFPLVVINHGKAPGDARRQIRARYPVAAAEFVRRGYVVAVPMRAGFSNSSGTYYSQGCDLEKNGLTQAQSVELALQWLRNQPFVDAKRIVMIGQSHGGLTTTALGTRTHAGVLALINFAGGLRQRNCPNWEENLVRAYAAYGRSNRYPMLWFYGDNDSYFPIALAREMHERYTEAGGRAELIAYGPFKADSHRLFGDRDGLNIWWPVLERMLKELRLPTAILERSFDRVEPSLAALVDARRIPHASARCQGVYEQFLYIDLPRAFAISSNGRCAFASRGRDPAQRALDVCQRNANADCRLYAVDEQVVWQ